MSGILTVGLLIIWQATPTCSMNINYVKEKVYVADGSKVSIVGKESVILLNQYLVNNVLHVLDLSLNFLFWSDFYYSSLYFIRSGDKKEDWDYCCFWRSILIISDECCISWIYDKRWSLYSVDCQLAWKIGSYTFSYSQIYFSRLFDRIQENL